jgi:hypothetical protein
MALAPRTVQNMPEGFSLPKTVNEAGVLGLGSPA